MDDRLTKRFENGRAGLAGNGTPCENMCKYPIVIDHLAAYEDLGTVEELAALKERTRWIPCSERLPNMCGFKCLVCAKNKFEQTHVFTAFTGYMEHWKLEFHSCEPPYDDLSAWEITHWMLLPEAPKEAQS